MKPLRDSKFQININVNMTGITGYNRITDSIKLVQKEKYEYIILNFRRSWLIDIKA